MLGKFSFANLIANWYLPLSALVLFGMQEILGIIHYMEMALAFIAWVIFCTYVSPKDLWKTSAESGLGVKIFSWLTALGVCIFSHHLLFERMLRHREFFDKILGLIYMSENVFYYFSFAVSLFSLIFVYLCVNYFWGKFLKLIRTSGLFQNMSRAEILFYSLLFTVSVLFATSVFIKSKMFFSAEVSGDTIYSSDTSYLVGRNCFINIAHPENDIRQPLFALFSIPFIGVPYLVARVIAFFSGHREILAALFMNFAQIAMLIAGIFTLVKTMELSPLYRVFFTLCFSCSYVYLLAVLMMEQYIVAFFWLSLCVYFVCNKHESDRMILYGAGGTLTTSFIFMPFLLIWGGVLQGISFE